MCFFVVLLTERKNTPPFVLMNTKKMEWIGGVAGGTLGYIAADLPGAYYGYEAGRAVVRNVTQNKSRMATTKRKRARSFNWSKKRVGAKRYKKSTRKSGRVKKYKRPKYRKGKSLGVKGPLSGPDSCRTAGTYIVQRRLRPWGKPFAKTLVYENFNHVVERLQNEHTWQTLTPIANRTHIGTLEDSMPQETWPSSMSVGSPSDRKFVMTRTDVMYDIKNATGQQVEAEIIWFHAARDSDTADQNGTPQKAMRRALTFNFGGNAVVTHYQRNNAPATFNMANDELYKMPLSAYAPYLKPNWKVAKTAKICLGPFEQQTINMKIIHNKMLTRLWTENSDHFAYLTVVPVIRVTSAIAPAELATTADCGQNYQPNWARLGIYEVRHTYGYRLQQSTPVTRVINPNQTLTSKDAPPVPLGTRSGDFPGRFPNNNGNVDLAQENPAVPVEG